MAKTQNSNINTPIGAKATDYDDGTRDLRIIFQGKDGKNYAVLGKIDKEKVIILISVEETKETGK